MRIRTHRRRRRWGFLKRPNPRLVAGLVGILGVGLFTGILLMAHHGGGGEAASMQATPMDDRKIPDYIRNVEQSVTGNSIEHLRATMSPDDIARMKESLSDQDIEKIKAHAPDAK